MPVGIAWFDEGRLAPRGEILRTGGAPLMPEEMTWPDCPSCGVPMLFRAQLPLSLTNLVAWDDARVLLLFECHADGGRCDEGVGTLVRGELIPRQPPAPVAWDVRLIDVGPRPGEVTRIVSALDQTEEAGGWAVLVPPLALMSQVPGSIATEAARAIAEAGGTADLRPSAPTVLEEAFGGTLVPFQDDEPNPDDPVDTSLPPLGDVMELSGGRRVRALLGGSTPGWRDHHVTCCGRPTRTAARLLGQHEPDPCGARLGPALVQVCLRCDAVRVFRSSSGRR